MEYELLQEIDAHYLLEYLRDLNETVNTWKMKIFDVYNAYKDIDCILIGHGKGSSLITDITSPNAWRFSDNNKSVWEFI